jgi:hypothetical protein
MEEFWIGMGSVALRGDTGGSLGLGYNLGHFALDLPMGALSGLAATGVFLKMFSRKLDTVAEATQKHKAAVQRFAERRTCTACVFYSTIWLLRFNASYNVLFASSVTFQPR